ncbi:extracellular serine/threonine protein kinase four-jointed-like [Ylistrum balloti]|uniref:extracellular serine/threonine protein kinase four-jointed-like n=1 Tax=Ylistrum balloti TaxID=509963 RepID=UPI002905A5CA|nr:extracellular serine/threonine protein kinase four-jointed-like [Ylistrum balloti]
MRKSTGYFMMGIGFTLGIVLGLLIQLPVITLPTSGREHVDHGLDLVGSGPDVRKRVVTRELSNDGNNNGLRSGEGLDRITSTYPLRGLKHSLHSVVYPINNGTKSHLQEKSVPIPDIKHDYKPQSSNQPVVLPPASDPDIPKPGQQGTDWVKAVSDMVDGVLWSPALENSCFKAGQSDKAQKQWREKSSRSKVVKMSEGCGRMQNRLLMLSDGTRACARYRLNTDQIQGEIYSFYLGRLLRINNLLPTVLSVVNSQSDNWRTVHTDMANAQWSDNKVVVLTRWSEGLNPAYIPVHLRGDDRALLPTSGSLGEMGACELMQWSDLIIFDYLIANLDRVVNNIHNKQWNSQMMESPAHNLERDSDGNLIFMDNESGLFHGYRLLDKYSSYHKSLLDSLCVFRNSTVNIIERLHLSGNVGEELHQLFVQDEPAHNFIPTIPKKNMKILQQRVGDVYEQIQRCRVRFM